MNYHNIVKDDMRNGPGLRATLFVAGCNHYCPECQNPITWDSEGGLPFDQNAFKELMDILSKDYIQGVTLSGGDPLYPDNRLEMFYLLMAIYNKFPLKDIWLYTGYTFENLYKDAQNDWLLHAILTLVDVIVDGPFIKDLADVTYHWAGSVNQRIIDVQMSLTLHGKVVLWRE